MSQCTARSKRTGKRCRAHAIPGRTVCHWHGGRSKRGPESGTWKDGRHWLKTTMPEGLRRHVEEVLETTDVQSLVESIALNRALMRDLLEDAGEAGQLDAKTREELRALLDEDRKLVESWSRILAQDHIPRMVIVAMLVDWQRKLVEVLSDVADRPKLAVLLAWIEGRLGGSEAPAIVDARSREATD